MPAAHLGRSAGVFSCGVPLIFSFGRLVLRFYCHVHSFSDSWGASSFIKSAFKVTQEGVLSGRAEILNENPKERLGLPGRSQKGRFLGCKKGCHPALASC